MQFVNCIKVQRR